MLKLFRLIAVKSSVVVLFLPEIALTQSLPVLSSQPPVVPNSDSDLVCYMQTEEGAVVNLDSLCKKKTSESERTVASSNRSSGNIAAAPPCYLFDANGRPCQK